MPAVVIAVSVKEGDIVEKGQGVVVVSAMKMETTLFAAVCRNRDPGQCGGRGQGDARRNIGGC